MRTIALLVLLPLLGACGGRQHDVADAFHWNTELPPGSTLHLRTSSGRIEVTPAHGNTASFSGSKRWVGRNDAVHFSWARNGDDVWVCAMTGAGGNCGPSYRPSDEHGSWLDMFSLFKRRPTHVEASISVELPPGVRVDARSNIGEVEIHGTHGGVTARTLSGAIDIDGVAGPIDAHSVNGAVDVAVDSLAPNDPVSVETVNGGVTVKLPPNTQGSVDLSTINGEVQSEFPLVASGEIASHRLRGQIGSSSREIRLKTINGSVELLKQSGEPENDSSAVSSSRRR